MQKITDYQNDIEELIKEKQKYYALGMKEAVETMDAYIAEKQALINKLPYIVPQGTITSYNTANLAREKGFDVNCDIRYIEHTPRPTLNSYKNSQVQDAIDGCQGYEYKAIQSLKNHYYYEFDNKDKGFYLAAPTHEVLAAWLRSHTIVVYVQPFLEYFKPKVVGVNLLYPQVQFTKTWEEAMDIALREGLKIIL